MKCALPLLLVVICSAASAQIVITGQINHYDGKSIVHYSETTDGILPAYDNVSKEVQPDARGGFRIIYQNKGLGNTRIGFAGLTYTFIHYGDAKIRFIIDQAKIQFPKVKRPGSLQGDLARDSVKQAATISIDGGLAAVNRYNNRMRRSSTIVLRVEGCDFSRLIRAAETPRKAVAIVDSLVQTELEQIALLNQHARAEDTNNAAFTPQVREYLEAQVYSFYGSVFLNGMMLKRFDQAVRSHRDPNAPHEIYNPEWERLTEHFLANASKTITPLPSSFEYNEFILACAYALDTYQKYDFPQPNTSNDELVVERLLNPRLEVLDSLKLLNDKAILAFKIHNLSRFLYTQTFYSPVLLSAVNKMKTDYAGSRLLEPYQPKIELLKEYLKRAAKDYHKARIVETNFLRFNDLLDTFKGKNLFIDVWATWCAPCVDAFNYKSVLKPFIDDGSISALYISIDQPRWKNKWKENIRFNELEGYHVLADDVLIKDMWEQLGGVAGMIPRYALVDKNGSLFLSNAASPSDGDRLVKQIKEMLGKSR